MSVVLIALMVIFLVVAFGWCFWCMDELDKADREYWALSNKPISIGRKPS